MTEFSRTLRNLMAALALSAPLVAPSVASAATASDTTQFLVTGGSLSFVTAPDVPNFSAVTLNGQAQTATAQMNAFSVDDATGTGSGWNVTANGDASAGKSAVFKQYCPNATCGSDSGPGYISGGATPSAGSLTLTGDATFTGLNGTTGTAPSFQCSSTPCAVDTSSATKIVSVASGGGQGPWGTSGFSNTSLALSTPTTTRVFTQPGEVYHVDLVWTLSSGP